MIAKQIKSLNIARQKWSIERTTQRHHELCQYII
jgi:hypothetical protein